MPPESAEHDVLEAVLLDVVAQPGAKRRVDLLLLGAEHRGHVSVHLVHLRRVRPEARAVRDGKLRGRPPLAAHVGAVAGVAQARRHDLAGVDRAERERLLELRAARQHRAGGAHGHAVAVEDELVLAADGVHEHDRRLVVHGALHEHPLAGDAVSAPVRRGRQVHEHLRSGQGLAHRGGPRLPDVLADGDSDRDPVHLEDQRLGSGLEVALLVEDAVVREVDLAVDGRHRAVGEHGRRVVDVVGPLREAHHGHDSPGLRREPLERDGRGVEEARLQQEVLRGVARERQLREHDQLGVALTGARGQVGDLGGVALDVAHLGVHLGERHSEQLAHVSIIAGSRANSRE